MPGRWLGRAGAVVREAIGQDAEPAFLMAFGRSPTRKELYKAVMACAATTGPSPLRALRAVIGAFDGQTHPSAAAVRFTEADLALRNFGSFSLWLDRADFSVSSTVGGDYEPHLSGFLRRHLKPGMTAVDIGANIGFHTMLMASLVGAEGRVLAFEPNSENCRLLLLSAEANNFSQISVFPVALSDRMGAVAFASMVGTNGGLLPEDQATLLRPNCVIVPTARLDDMVQGPIHLIKADVEGAEYLALSGARDLIGQWRPIITSEFSLEMLARVSGIEGRAFLDWIVSLGYRLFLLGRNGGGCQEAGIDNLLATWGNPLRIEDLAFMPQEAGPPA